MKQLILIPFLFITSDLFAQSPDVGVEVKYTSSKSSSNYFVEDTYKIAAESNLKRKKYLVSRLTSDGQRFTYWDNASSLYNKNVLKNCGRKGGTVELVTTKAGTFRACKTQATKSIKNKIISILFYSNFLTKLKQF